MSFANQVKGAADRMIAKVKKDHHSVALELYTKIIQKTPVDTGEARRSWNFEKVPDGYLISTNAPYMPVLEWGLYVTLVDDSTGSMRETPKTINGFSKQAPQGFVRISIKEVANKWK